MIPLLVSLAAIGIALVLLRPRLKRSAQKKYAIKVAAIEKAGGMLAKEMRRNKTIPRDAFEILSVAANQQDIRFDLATDRVLQVVPYPTGRMNYVQLDDVSQLPDVSPDQMVVDDGLFYQNFVTRQIIRPEYYEEMETFKRLYILLDVSGSMFLKGGSLMPDGHVRDTWARGVVVSLLVDAVNGNAEYLFRTFSTEVSPLSSARTPGEAEGLLTKIVRDGSGGGGTAIGKAVTAAVSDIRRLQSSDSRINHILLITDGDDQAGLTRGELSASLGSDVQLHVVLIGTTWGLDHPLAPYVVANY